MKDVRSFEAVSVTCMEQEFGRMVTTTEESPAGALTPRGRDQLGKGVDVTDITYPAPSRLTIALSYVSLATADLETAAAQRLYYWGLARKYGATFQQIGDAVGLTDAAIRIALKRVDS